MTYYQTIYTSPIGEIFLLASCHQLLGACFCDQTDSFSQFFDLSQTNQTETSVLVKAQWWLDAYFQGEKPEPPDYLALRGTPFQNTVWQALQSIPYGQTQTYGQIAKKLNCRSAQAIGAALGRNPLLLFLPCHRVLGRNHQLTGYAGGLERKAWLLDHEQNRLETL
ncbi:methylated-DNA--[protein]-cysteine S-methyltransferase [Streptococcus halichoeri]|uniref:methylated-DNA--[protein]-cysteine S-methyltransferase n=1 Tax=Streptococcus halichoeri TaxID=254785 RepID=UPI0013570748|nr:methylated-DNA--[protein]-cysteine S-methyltransferase [Streptococcus halichoeri]